MKVDKNGQYPYNGVIDCLTKSIKKEGVRGLWVGYPVYYARIAPHAMIVLIDLYKLDAYYLRIIVSYIFEIKKTFRDLLFMIMSNSSTFHNLLVCYSPQS